MTNKPETKVELIKQVLKAAAEIKKAYTFDDRFYEIIKDEEEPVYYPSVSTVLGYTKTGFALDKYKQEQAERLGVEGARLQLLLQAEQGTRVHQAIEDYLNGDDIHWFNAEQKKTFTDFEWQRFARFIQWLEVHDPKMINTEEIVYCEKYEYAGQFDAVMQLGDQKYLCDWKTSKAVQSDHLLQSAAYWYAYKERHGKELDGILVLALNKQVPKNAKNPEKCQGWSMSIKDKKESKALFVKFLNRLRVFQDNNPNFEPKRDLLPISFIHES